MSQGKQHLLSLTASQAECPSGSIDSHFLHCVSSTVWRKDSGLADQLQREVRGSAATYTYTLRLQILVNNGMKHTKRQIRQEDVQKIVPVSLEYQLLSWDELASRTKTLALATTKPLKTKLKQICCKNVKK